MEPGSNDRHNSNIPNNKYKIEDIFNKNCVLYFPPNRFEEPAWLNERNLKAQAEYMDIIDLTGHRIRKLINHSRLHDNQNWLFNIIYDMTVFETQTSNQTVSLPVPLIASGNATRTYKIVLQLIQSVMRANRNVRLGIGGRLNRVISIEGEPEQIVPNVFHLSSGETSLMNLFLSILRDFDLCGASFTNAEEIRGIAIVDEIDLHLHAVHQNTILPGLIQMFPNVQFVVTTHSPLFVLGMKKIFGENGFALHLLPSGQQISPEEFSEFENAYQTFTKTSKFSEEIRKEIKNAQKPIIFVESTTDRKYLEKAFQLLDQKAMLERIEMREIGGTGTLTKIWKSFVPDLAESISQKIVLLHDCDISVDAENKNNLFRRNIPKQSEHPIDKGIENLFSRAILEKALNYKSAFINITSKHDKTNRGKSITVPEKWAIHKDEKTILCNWLCENGTQDDFQYFREIFELLKAVLNFTPNGI